MSTTKITDTSHSPSIINRTQARKLLSDSLDKIANKCGAKIRVGEEVVYDRKRLEEFLSS